MLPRSVRRIPRFGLQREKSENPQMVAHPHLRGKNHRICVASFAIWVLCLGATLPCAGQAPDTTIAGTITSAAGTPIANATITVKNLATNEVRTLTANADGTYTLKNLAPGRYEITASASGYSAAVTTVSLRVNSSSSANLVLQLVPPGAAGKTSSSSAVSGVVDSNSVSNLPLNGRSASDLAALEPGVERAYAADRTSTARLR